MSSFDGSVILTTEVSKNSMANLPFPVLTSSKGSISDCSSAVKESPESLLVISPLPRNSDISPISVYNAETLKSANSQMRIGLH